MESKSDWSQATITLKSRTRGCYLITDEIISQIKDISKYSIGILNLFLQHTSASICLNENYDSDVQEDMESILNRIVPESNKLYKHSAEGKDDMPGHAKSALIGCNLSIPITNGSLNLGTWQGIWLLEHRDGSHSRRLVATINGKLK